MSIDQTLSETVAKLEKELAAVDSGFERYLKYKDMSPEEIAGSANFSQATKDHAAIDAFAKSINAAMPHAKKLLQMTTGLDQSLAGQMQMMNLTMIKLASVGQTVKKIDESMKGNFTRLDALESSANLMEHARMSECHSAPLAAAAGELEREDEITGKLLYHMAGECGNAWMELGHKIGDFKTAVMKIRSALKNAAAK